MRISAVDYKYVSSMQRFLDLVHHETLRVFEDKLIHADEKSFLEQQLKNMLSKFSDYKPSE